ncbi:hypothetical protein [Alkaliphilus sp. B6464]|uniref:hypothetical protein n=1 Tax=Alkaliphilus sp. B6464 TaxID=2731219 RepID=UPI001BA84EEC|nr:hypothetical protein [Alkaliphilus sp. B6464]QUH21812.1 hypothetical protein HYG84_17910 [Alkaliphilus sp. B6464]
MQLVPTTLINKLENDKVITRKDIEDLGFDYENAIPVIHHVLVKLGYKMYFSQTKCKIWLREGLQNGTKQNSN